MLIAMKSRVLLMDSFPLGMSGVSVVLVVEAENQFENGNVTILLLNSVERIARVILLNSKIVW